MPSLELPQLQPPAINQEKYLHSYSWGALVYSVFYFFAMQDWLFVILSGIAAFVPIALPLIFILPFFARQRAWEHHYWESFDEFYAKQQAWDRSGKYGAIAAIILLALLFFLFMHLLSSLGGPDFLQNLQDTYSAVQN